MPHSIAPLSAVLLLGFASLLDADETVSFNHDIRPLLSDRCFACHGPDENDRQAELRLDQAEGEDGAYRDLGDLPAIAPGSAEGSEVWNRITSDDPDLRMPPADSHKKPLTTDQLEAIRQWIESGANYETFWAFVPPKAERLPEVKAADWSEQAIDRFVLARLESKGMRPSVEADKRTLIRRLSLDLRGLPPTTKEIQQFLADEHPNAYENLVDEYLNSSQFGEHMARHWLDLVRFADTNGMHKDFYRNFTAYRDWVIRAFNSNLPYDEFVQYQLAGDLFPSPTQDQLVASGFNRLHLIIDRGTALPEESFFKNVIDRVSAVGTVFMGMTVQCAQCHDHKYDPISQRDYYSLFAFFNNIDAEPETVRAPPNGLQPPFISLATQAEQVQLQRLEEELASLETAWKLSQKELQDASQRDGANEVSDRPQALEELQREERQAKTAYTEAKKKRDTFDASILKAMVMKERDEVRPTFVMNRGQYDAPGEAVGRDTPSFLPPLQKEGPVASRMDLARWFTSEQNPLTARVAVNRFWQQFFGVGLVKTSEDIGAQGEVPSHPELLDYLAIAFQSSGWDVKALLKQIVMSQTYRQSSRASAEAFRKDPENRMLSRGSRFRLDAEVIRDQVLATSGLLSGKMYGPSVKPPQPAGLWKAVTMTNERFVPDQGDDIYRRSLYTFWKRAMPPPQMTILNAPNRDACTARRERTNTPSQALLLLNEAEYLKAARHLAAKALELELPADAARVASLYETITGQLPDAQERDLMIELVQDLRAQYETQPELAAELCDGLAIASAEAQAELSAWTVLVNILYNLDITKNRE